MAAKAGFLELWPPPWGFLEYVAWYGFWFYIFVVVVVIFN